jgi:preprotein translocase subunit SecF
MKNFQESTFYLLFKKPLLLFLLFSCWPILVFVVPYGWIGVLQLLIFIHIGLSIYLLLTLKTYFMYVKFPTFTMALDYHRELKKVQRLEQKTKAKQKQKEKLEKAKRLQELRIIQEKKRKEEEEIQAIRLKELKTEQEKQNAINEKIRVQKMLDDLEARKKKVL